jgi:hypothetical protein
MKIYLRFSLNKARGGSSRKRAQPAISVRKFYWRLALFAGCARAPGQYNKERAMPVARISEVIMKKVLLPLVLAVFTFSASGCARNYVMRLSNGMQITTASKPKLKGATYYFKDATGRVNTIPQGRVLEIMPASMANEKPRFKPSLQ